MLETHRKIISEVVAQKRKDPNIVCIFLYGSFARGTATEKSDVDIELVVKKGEYSDTSTQRYGIKVDFETWPQRKLSERIKKYPYLSFPYTEEKILYDPEGFGKKLQKEIKTYFIKNSEARKTWLNWKKEYLQMKRRGMTKTNRQKVIETEQFYDELERKFSRGKNVKRDW